MSTYRHKKTDILLVTILVLISGSPVLFLCTPVLYGFLGVIAVLYSFSRKDWKDRDFLWKYCLFLSFIFLCQLFTLKFISFLGSINVIAKIVLGATIMWKLKEDFRAIYFKVIYWFSIISLIFFFADCLGYDIPNLFSANEQYSSIIIYNKLIKADAIGRNCGPFWEPGAFACYLLLIPLLYIEELKEMVSNKKKESIILFITLITTFSTTGYICLGVLIIYYYLKFKKNKLVVYLVYLPILLLLTVYAYNDFDFLGGKIEAQTKNSLEVKGDFSNTRMGSLFFDIHYIKKHPIIGNGLHEQTRYADHPFLWGGALGHGNAFSNYTAQMGIVAIVIYFFLLYKGFNKKIIVPIIVLLLFQGEQLLNYPIYLSLPFVILFKTCKYNKNNENTCHNYYSLQSQK